MNQTSTPCIFAVRKNSHPSSMLRMAFILFLALAFVGNGYSQKHKAQHSAQLKSGGFSKWSVDPFNQKVFIENKTQFDGMGVHPSDKVMYGVRSGGLQIFFSPSGLAYRHQEPVKISREQREEMEKEGKEVEELMKTKTDSISMEWVGANPNTEIVSENPVESYFTYGDKRDKSGKTTIKATAFQKITYKNLYPGIDVVYTFPEGKSGLKYAIIVHPGADPSVIKMKYSGGKDIRRDKDGNVIIPAPFGPVIDHAPVTTYEDGTPVNSSFSYEKRTVSFGLQKIYDQTKTLIIDPWTTVPTMTSSSAYDVDCDLAGNVYIYGGSFPFQEQKLSPAGAILWTYTSAFTNSYYGDFCVDGHSQNSYLTEGFNGSGAQIIKVSTNGAQLAMMPSNANMMEMWRIVWNNCTHSSVIAGGGTGPVYQTCVLDSNAATITPVNSLNAVGPLHDFALLALDNNSQAYMATAKSQGDPLNFDNAMIKVPVPALTPQAFNVSDGYTFVEVASVLYAPGPPNGFNGMAVSPNFLYTYDGATLKKWSKTTGALLGSVATGGTSFTSGGLTVDECDHIFVGQGSNVKQYNSSLALVSTLAAANTVYDVKLGLNGLLYACGLQFVEEFNVSLTPCSALSLTITATSLCSATNTATVTASGGTGPYTYSWSTTPVQTTATATGLTPGWYYVNVTDNSCIPLTSRDSVQVTASSGPTVTASPNVTICNGGNTVLTASGATTYSWTPSTGLSSTTVANPTASPTVTTTYTVTGTTGSCSNTATVTVTVAPGMTLNVTMTQSTCSTANGSVNVAITSGGTAPFTYSWSSGQTTANVTGLTAGTYSVTVTDHNGCIATGSVTVTNTGGPTVAVSSITNVTCFGSCNGSIVVTATATAMPIVYSWSGNPSTTNTASGLCAGNYTCTVTDANNCAQSITGTVTQPPQLTVTIAPPTNVLCFGGNTGAATATVTGGTGAPTYTWTPAPGGGQGTANATGLTAQTYSLTIADANGCPANASVTITQPTQLTLALAGTPATCNGLCNGVLICIPSGGTSTYTYSWSTGCNTASCNNICAGTYSITVTDAHNCTATGSTTITQPTAMSLTTSSVTAHCNRSDGSASVTATGGTGPNYTYTWTPTGVGSSNATYSNIPPLTSYTVMVHDQNGCADSALVAVGNIPGVTASIVSSTNVSCFGGTNGSATATTAGAVGPVTYSWNSAPVQTTPAASNLPMGTYTCTVTDSIGCTNTTTVNITQPTQVVETPMAPVTICITGCTPLTSTATGGTGAITSAWTSNASPVTPPVCPTTTTTYTVIGTDANGCVSAPAFVTVTVNPPLEVVTAGAASLCPGSTATLSSTPTGGNGGPYTYSWFPATGLSSTTVQNPVATPTVTTTYTVIVSDNCNTPTDSAVVTVNVFPAPVATLTAPDTAECSPFCFSFNVGSVPNCASANWTFGDGGLGTGCGAVTHCYTTAGLYSVSVNITDVNGCTTTVTNTNWINVWPVPVAAFIASPQPTTILNPTITFTDTSTNANTWLWNFGDLSNATSTLKNPRYTYQDTGCYNVTEIVKSSHGCLDTTGSVVCILGDFTFYAPNCFTPNGDGKNDIWLPQGIGIDPSTYQLYMFDRWGNLIWSTEVWGKGWDGRANNGSDIAQIDTYVWKVSLRDFQGNKHAYTGVCNLIK